MARPCPLLKTMVSAVVVMSDPMVGLSWHKSFIPLFSVCNLPRHATLLHIDVQLKLTVKTILHAQHTACKWHLRPSKKSTKLNFENIEKSTFLGAKNCPFIA